jgi:hypothetical protein
MQKKDVLYGSPYDQRRNKIEKRKRPEYKDIMIKD